MTDPFGTPGLDPQPDFSGLYTDDNAPKAQDPSQQLFSSLADAAKAASSAQATPTAAAQAPQSSGSASGAAPAAPAPASPGSAAPAAPVSAGLPTAADPQVTALLARLAPKGITSLDQLKGKTDLELRQLSNDVVAYESRQKSLNQYFYKNPDGTFDLTKGPDGTPTGLDAQGRVPPPATAAAPAPKAAPPAAKPKHKPAKKPAAKKKTAARKPAPKRTVVRHPVKKKPAAKKPAPKTVAKTPVRVTLPKAKIAGAKYI